MAVMIFGMATSTTSISGTDLASVSSLVVASTSYNFVVGDVGSLIRISSGTGFTPGIYRIVSVSINQATLDKSPGTVGVGGVWSKFGFISRSPFPIQVNTGTF